MLHKYLILMIWEGRGYTEMPRETGDPQASHPRTAQEGTAPASMDAGPAFAALRRLASRDCCAKRRALVAVRAGEPAARLRRFGSPALSTRRTRTGRLAVGFDWMPRTATMLVVVHSEGSGGAAAHPKTSFSASITQRHESGEQITRA